MNSTNLKTAIKSLRANPTNIQGLICDVLEQSSNGEIRIVDPSNPMVFALETSVVNACNTIEEIENITRPMYKANVTSWDDLYLHMNDDDYLGRFASPGQATIMFFFSLDELKQVALPIYEGSEIKKLTIPRNSRIRVSGTVLTLLYPIDITIAPYGAYTVKYNVERKNPVQSIRDTLIQSEIRRDKQVEYLYFQVPMLQLDVITSTTVLSGIDGYQSELKFTDKFLYCRAYMRNENENWQEIGVKHTPFHIDVTQPTLVVKVKDASVEVHFPQIYKNNGMLKDNLRIDIYTTQGDVNIPLGNLTQGSFETTWVDYDDVTKNKFSAALNGFSNLKIGSADEVTGGSEGRSFNEQRRRVVNRSNITDQLPITSEQLTNKLTDLGFSAVTVLDNVTDRKILASRLLPAPTDSSTVTGIGCSIQNQSISLAELATHTQTVRSNGPRLTVLPSTVYTLDNDLVKVVDHNQVATWRNPNLTSLDSLVNIVNSGRYFFSPYHYVHDTAGSEYAVRAYRLDNPSITGKVVDNENTSLLLTSNISGYFIEVNADSSGYKLYVQLEVSQSFKSLNVANVFMQMRISDENNRSYYWFNGKLETAVDSSTGRPLQDLYVYSFDLPTNWDINEKHQILIGDSEIPFPLESAVNLYTIVKDHFPAGAYQTSMDKDVKVSSLAGYNSNSLYTTVICERMSLKLGAHLEHLWTRARSTITADMYERYAVNIPSIYEQNVYDADANGNPIFTYNSELQKLDYVIIHHAGDPVLDEDGQPQYKHQAGDVVLDVNGEPVIVGGQKGILRQFDMFLLDGKYYFATHEATITYRESIKDTVDSWMVDLIKEMVSGELLGRTDIYYYPRSTVGDLKLLTDGNKEIYVPADQRFKVIYSVSETVDKNEDLKKNITRTTIATLYEVITSSTTISHSKITKALEDAIGNDQLGVSIEGWMEDKYRTVSILDQSVSPSIAKRLVITSNLELIVEDDVDVTFIVHQVTA